MYQDKETMMPFRTDIGTTGDTAAQQQAANEERERERLLEQAAEQRRRDEQQRVRMRNTSRASLADQAMIRDKRRPRLASVKNTLGSQLPIVDSMLHALPLEAHLSVFLTWHLAVCRLLIHCRCSPTKQR